MAPSTRLQRHAQTLELGDHLESWRWTKYHYFLLAAFAGAFTAGYFVSWLRLLRDGWKELGHNGFLGWILVIGIVALTTLLQAGLAGVTWHFLWGALSGIGRGLHLYEKGLIVSRPGSLQAWHFRSLSSIRVERSSTPSTGSFNVSITLTGLDGRKLVMDKRKTIPAVEHAARRSGAHPLVDDRASGGPDSGGNTGGPDEPSGGSAD